MDKSVDIMHVEKQIFESQMLSCSLLRMVFTRLEKIERIFNIWQNLTLNEKIEMTIKVNHIFEDIKFIENKNKQLEKRIKRIEIMLTTMEISHTKRKSKRLGKKTNNINSKTNIH